MKLQEERAAEETIAKWWGNRKSLGSIIPILEVFLKMISKRLKWQLIDVEVDV